MTDIVVYVLDGSCAPRTDMAARPAEAKKAIASRALADQLLGVC
jgi:hypothetical protein